MLEKKRNPPGAGLARKSRHAVPSRSRSLRQAAREHGKGGGPGPWTPERRQRVGWAGGAVYGAARAGARRIPGPPPPGPAASRTGPPGSAVARAGSPGPAASRTRRRPDRSSQIPGPGHPIPPSPRAGPPGPAGLRDRGAGVRPPPGRGPCVPGRLPDTDRRMVRGTSPAACTGPRPPGCPCPMSCAGPSRHGLGPRAPPGRAGLSPTRRTRQALPPACRTLRARPPGAGRRGGLSLSRGSFSVRAGVVGVRSGARRGERAVGRACTAARAAQSRRPHRPLPLLPSSPLRGWVRVRPPPCSAAAGEHAPAPGGRGGEGGGQLVAASRSVTLSGTVAMASGPAMRMERCSRRSAADGSRPSSRTRVERSPW
ncbi:Hypothetical Protein sle_03430 [Streptomyces leeuwenhoekii]|uniref:Uncharacterized protein n=1 Tax=Streptomyces leeuwenhoekii TaxID=1437453 RepID=A0A0F7VLP9_STRLW|nr:Hypothetical Protein sle_03430 [Streptomyces leeuwenhoekii]